MNRLVLILAAALLSGCTNSPTATTRTGVPVRLDAGGGSFGSGNYVGVPAHPAGRASGGSESVTAASGSEALAAGDSTSSAGAGRGGGSFGSGN